MGESILTRKGGGGGFAPQDVYAKGNTGQIYRLNRIYNNATAGYPINYISASINNSGATSLANNSRLIFENTYGLNANTIKNVLWSNVVDDVDEGKINGAFRIRTILKANSSQNNIYAIGQDNLKYREYKFENDNNTYSINHWVEDNNASNAPDLTNVYFGFSTVIDGPNSVSSFTNTFVNTTDNLSPIVIASNNSVIWAITNPGLSPNANIYVMNHNLTNISNRRNTPIGLAGATDAGLGLKFAGYAANGVTPGLYFLSSVYNGSIPQGSFFLRRYNALNLAAASSTVSVFPISTVAATSAVLSGFATGPNYVFYSGSFLFESNNGNTGIFRVLSNGVGLVNNHANFTNSANKSLFGNIYYDTGNEFLYMLAESNITNREGIWKINALAFNSTNLTNNLSRVGYINTPITASSDRITGDGGNIYLLNSTTKTVKVYNTSNLSLILEGALVPDVFTNTQTVFVAVSNYIVTTNHAYYKSNMQFSHFISGKINSSILGGAYTTSNNTLFYSSTGVGLNIIQAWDLNNISGNNSLILSKISAWTGEVI